MNRADYFRRMEETSVGIDSSIWQALKPLNEQSPELYQTVINIPQFKKRVNKKRKLRPFLLRSTYELVGGRDLVVINDFGAAAELLNISTYIDNGIFDNKGNLRDNAAIKNEMIAARVLRDVATRLIREKSGDFGLERFLEEVDYQIYVGQYSDLNQFHYSKTEQLSAEQYLELYVQRCYQLTGIFLENICIIGAKLGNTDEETVEKLADLGRNLGIMVQIVNDLGDFVPPTESGNCDVEKEYQDQYSDLRQGKVTLPLRLALENSTKQDQDKIVNVLSDTEHDFNDYLEITRILVHSGAITQTKRLAGLYSHQARIILNKFEDSLSRTDLIMMSQMYRTNKYLAALRRLPTDPTAVHH